MTLRDQLENRVFNQFRIAMIREAVRELTEDPGAKLDLSQQQAAAVGTDRTAVESGGDFTPSEPLEFKLRCVTLCLHGAASLLMAEVLLLQQLMPKKAAFFYGPVRNPG